MGAQRWQIEAWIGDDHGLDDEQIDQLTRIADEITEQYPDQDDNDLASQALVAAYRLMIEPVDDVLADFARQRSDARAAEAAAVAGLQQAARILLPRGDISESEFSRKANIDRMAVRRWMGKQ